MAGYRNHNTMLQLEGFDELITKLQQAGREVDFECEKMFSECCKVTTDTLVERARAANLDEDLLKKMIRKKWHRYNVFHFEVGWEKPHKGKPLPDAYKVMFINYGTPYRQTRKGEDRGRIEGRGFIGKAKKSAKYKVKRLQKKFLEDVLKDLKQ